MNELVNSLKFPNISKGINNNGFMAKKQNPVNIVENMIQQEAKTRTKFNLPMGEATAWANLIYNNSKIHT